MKFKYGDLVIKCHQCGGVQMWEEMVTEGRAIYLFTDTDSHMKLTCPTCNITMEAAIIPNEKANEEIEDAVIVEEEPVTNEELPKESTAEETV